MDEKIAVVTGASSGIGREVARALARRGFRVAMVSRSEVRGADAADDVRGSAPGARVETFFADLSSRADVRRLAERLRERYRRLDVLVNNAGVHLTRAKVSVDGFDRMVATNHLGPFLLTNLLRELLVRSAPSRVVVVASEAHRRAGALDAERFAEPGAYGAAGSHRVYARTKLLNVLFALELADRLEGTGVAVHALCPGPVATGLKRDLPTPSRTSALLARTPLLRTAEQGARPVVRLAADPEFATGTGYHGSVYHGSVRLARLLKESPACRDVELRRTVWERSAHLVGLPSR
ncbi:SDR family NAD(P)-dependent oxidoreductase [Actinomadura atramentaria]|uniref:SDR family NAD(P)-dependent oxidoreductase n=1 Tax=Actinomadura atramentaria TaxID=1990 RepID=UPI0003786ABA|nr:SDR family NAD(P)-dependent oxidoreductase [Actinomadura atramentaria]